MNHVTLVAAGAGSGKTWRIETELTRLVVEGCVAADRILAVTFTEAAAAELRRRLREALIRAGQVEDALAIDRAYVGTIHSLGQRLLTEHAFAAGHAPRSRLVTEAERGLLIRAGMMRSGSLAPLRRDVGRYGYAYDHESGLSAEEQFRADFLKAVDVIRGLGDAGLRPDLVDGAAARLRVIAGPVENDGAPLTAALLAAVRALHEAFPSGVATCATSPSATNAFRKNCRHIRDAATVERILDRDWALWQQLRNLRLSKRGCPTPSGYDPLAQAVMDAADALPRHPGPLEDAVTHLTALVRGAQETLDIYAEAKRRGGLIDYADMIAEAEVMLRTRPEIRHAVLSEIDCVVIDEFQDTNPAQFSLLWQLAREAPRALIVGDAKQAIMGFQGADARLSEALANQMPDRVEAQETNRRSMRGIMALVNAVGPALFPDRYDPLAAHRGDSPGPCLEAIPVGPRGDPSEADGIADRLRRMIDERELVTDPETGEVRPVRPADIAVLCYRHKGAAAQAAALRRVGLPVQLPEPGWLSSPAVLAARMAVAFAADPGDRLAALTLSVLGPSRQPLREMLSAILEERAGEDLLSADDRLTALAELTEEAKTVPVGALARKALSRAGLREWCAGLPDAPAALADLARFEAEADAFDTLPETLKAAAGLPGSGPQVFLGWLAERTDPEVDNRPGWTGRRGAGVEVVTWHAAKGREWPVVVVSGLDQPFPEWVRTLRAEFESFDDPSDVLSRAGLTWMPDFKAKEVQQRFLDARRAEDERAAAAAIYVALTRARDRLVLSLPKAGSRDDRMIDLLRARAGLELGAGTITVCDAALPCAVSEPALAEEMAATPAEHVVADTGRPRPPAALTLWRQSPSSRVGRTNAPRPKLRTRDLGAPVPTADVLMHATDRGTAWHLAFRTLAARPDLAPRLQAATGLTAETLDAIACQAQAARRWLAGEGFARLRFEVPLQVADPFGAETNAVIDCLAEGPAGICILDHKSGPCPDPAARFATYLPQLEAYAEMAGHSLGRPVALLAINWMTEGRVSAMDIAFALDAS